MSSNITYYDQETNTYFVAGTHASLYEFNVALALDKLKIDYTFQFSPWGFTGVRGQYIVDFLVYNPMPLPVEVFGEHWHTGQLGSDDKMRLAQIEQYFNQMAEIIWGRECDSYDKALATCREKFT